MAHDARRLIETALRIHALAPWDDSEPDDAFAFQVPGHAEPFAGCLLRDDAASALVLFEGGLTAWCQSLVGGQNDVGAEIGMLIAPLRKIPPEYRGVLETAKWHGRRDAPAVSLVVRRAGRRNRSARASEIRTALFAATAFLKTWESGDLVPRAFHDPDGVPLLRLSGAPHDPAIEWDRLVLEDAAYEEFVEFRPVSFEAPKLPDRLRCETPRRTDATWSIGGYWVPPFVEGTGLQFFALAVVDGASDQLLHSDMVAAPAVNGAAESIRRYADGEQGSDEPSVPAVIQCGARDEVDQQILEALRPLFEPHGVQCRIEPRLPAVERTIEESKRASEEFRRMLPRAP